MWDSRSSNCIINRAAPELFYKVRKYMALYFLKSSFSIPCPFYLFLKLIYFPPFHIIISVTLNLNSVYNSCSEYGKLSWEGLLVLGSFWVQSQTTIRSSQSPLAPACKLEPQYPLPVIISLLKMTGEIPVVPGDILKSSLPCFCFL